MINPLPHLAVYEVTGTDREHFLHGQLTNDLLKLPELQWQLTAYCSPRGRILATFYLYKANQVVYLVTPHAGAAQIISRLKMFIMRSDVNIEPSNDLKACMSKADTLNEHQQTPSFHFANQTKFGLCLCEHPTEGNTDADDVWASCLIEAGVVEISEKTRDLFVPQMINWEKLGGVSFKKGCYPGQEIVARSEYLGKLKRHLYLAKASSQLELGTSVMSRSSDHDELTHAGNVAMSHRNGMALLVLSDHTKDTALFSETSQEIELLDTPFSYI